MVSSLGDWLATVATMALVYGLAGSSTAVAGVLVMRLLPAAVVGPLASRLAVRTRPRWTMLAMDVVRIPIVLAIPLVGATWWVYLWAFALETAGLVFVPSRDALVPDLVDPDALPVVNGLLLGASYATIPFGAGAYALIAGLLGGDVTGRGRLLVVFGLDAVTFLASFAAVAGISTRAPHPTPGDEAAAPSRRRLRQTLELDLVRRTALPVLVASLGIGSLFSLGITLVRQVLGASETQFGVLVALFGVGAALGIGLLQVTGWSGFPTVRGGVVGQGVVIAVMSLSPGIWPTFAGAAAFGAATAIGLSAAMGTVQASLDERDRVDAFTFFHVTIRLGLAGAALGAGLAADRIAAVSWPVVGRLEPARVVLFAAGALVAVVAAVAPGPGESAAGAGELCDDEGQVGSGPPERVAEGRGAIGDLRGGRQRRSPARPGGGVPPPGGGAHGPGGG